MTDTLVTKVMLGVFGCVPAFDQNVTRGLRMAGLGNGSLNHATLAKIGNFYRQHLGTIEKHRVPTLDFDSEGPTYYRYTRAKVIDMAFFVEGGR